MNKILCSAIAFSLCLFAVQCSQMTPADPAAVANTKSVKVAIRVPAAFDTIAAKTVAMVSAPDMQPITTTLVQSNDTLVTGIIGNIPVGSNRFFEVYVYGFDGKTEYYGCANADISSRDTTLVTIVLRKPFGTAVINGYIEEYYPDSGHISAVTIPYIVKSWPVDSAVDTGVVVEFATTPVYSKVAFDTIVYSWAVVSLNVDTIYVDTMYQTILTGTPNLEVMLNTNGRYMVMVKASCMQHGVAETSGALYFSIRGGRVYPDNDTIVPPAIDRDPPVISFPWNNPVTIGKLDTLDYSAVQANDAKDGNLSSHITVSGEIIYGVPGTYHLVFTAADFSGNMAQAKLEVRISRRQHESFQVIPY